MNKVKTERKRLNRALNTVAEACRNNRHAPVREQQKSLKAIIAGHIEYYGMSYNFAWLKRFVRGVERVWKKWLNRRGSPRAITWPELRDRIKRDPWPELKIKHRLFEVGKPAAKQPRQLKLHLM